MTNVTVATYNERCYFEAVGHAINELKEDSRVLDDSERAVCAAISILLLTAAHRLSEMEARGDFISSHIRLEEGYALFDIEPRYDTADEVTELFDTIECGCMLLEENYPQLIALR